ncbi:MAG: hypothetical protein MUE82_13545, partial [Chloroflexi bacterium]|nr:hypothetical protein [Chloroflexota bacterium]
LVTLLMGAVMILALAVIVLGIAPDLEAALYTTIVVLILVGAGFSLMELVWSQRRPATSP